jgi:nickel/cobalt exporter
MTRSISRCTCFGLAALVLLIVIDPALAQPFGMSRSAPPDLGGLTGWILAEQARFYLTLSHLIRASKADGSAAWTLLGVSFIYGVFHAAGPGHGKAVISSYLVANDETWRRGVILSFASAVLQSLSAIVIVAVAAVLLNATAKAMNATVRVVEMVGYVLIVLVGLRLLWVKGRALLRLLSAAKPERHAQGHHDYHHHDHDHGHDHGHAHGDHHGHAHDYDDDASAWGHAHAPEPSELTGTHWFRRAISAVIAVGLRPCSGAIIVLVFALAQGLFWIGVASTVVMGLGTAITVGTIATIAVSARSFAGRIAKAKPGRGMILLRLLETAAAAAIVVFGVALLTGYMVSERMGLF